MEYKKKKRIIIAFFIFMIFMWFCTVLSKSIYVSKLPIITTESIEQKYVEHIVQADGIVVAGEKIPVTVLGGLRVDKLMVQAGDRVEEDDVILTIDMEDLNDMIEEKQTAISKLQVQINTIVQNEELTRQKKELDEQRAREDYDAIARRENTLVGRAANEYSKVEDKISDQNSGESAEDLQEALQQAAYAEADARWQRDNAIKEAGRKVEDIIAPESKDSSLEVSRLELADLQEDLSRFQEIKDAEGEIRARQSGLVTDIYIGAGGRTSDSAVMLLADDAVPCQFKAVISQEQKKHVGLNDTVALKLDGNREKELTVDYLTESSTMPGSYDLYINLPEGIGMPGMSGTISRSDRGDKYPCCVTPGAVHTDLAISYVYVVRERDGILGKEYYAEQVNVRIQDENDYWVAVEGALDNDSRIISISTKEVKNGDAVRWEE